jgi:hypothetical protein
MGARTNYTIVTTDNPAQNINVYAHWDGEEGPSILWGAVKAAKPRWNDTSYAARIIVDQLTKHGRDSETGYGIYIGEEITHEEEYEYKEVNLVNQTVTISSQTFKLDEYINAVV